MNIFVYRYYQWFILWFFCAVCHVFAKHGQLDLGTNLIDFLHLPNILNKTMLTVVHVICSVVYSFI